MGNPVHEGASHFTRQAHGQKNSYSGPYGMTHPVQPMGSHQLHAQNAAGSEQQMRGHRRQAQSFGGMQTVQSPPAETQGADGSGQASGTSPSYMRAGVVAHSRRQSTQTDEHHQAPPQGVDQSMVRHEPNAAAGGTMNPSQGQLQTSVQLQTPAQQQYLALPAPAGPMVRVSGKLLSLLATPAGVPFFETAIHPENFPFIESCQMFESINHGVVRLRNVCRVLPRTLTKKHVCTDKS